MPDIKPEKIDWYERRDELEPEMVFTDFSGDLVKLDFRVPGDGSQWYVADWLEDHWSYECTIIEPADLDKQVPDPAAS